MKNDTTPNSYKRYLHDMGQYDVLTPDEEKECAQNMEDAYNALVNEMLKLPHVWLEIYNKWARIKEEGKSTNKMAEEYGNKRHPAEELTLQVDAHIEAALYFMEPKTQFAKASYLFKAAGLSKEIYMSMVDELLAQPEYRVPDEAKQLITQHRDTLMEYQHQLTTANLRLVVSFARRFNNYGIPFIDLVQEGNLGLIRAVEKFDHTRGRFSTYAAHWIKQAFIKALKGQGKTIRLPSHIHDALIKLKKAYESLSYEMEDEPSIAVVADRAGVDVALVESLLELRDEPLSLEMPYYPHGRESRPKCLSDFIEDENISPTDSLDRTKRNNLVKGAMKELLTDSEKTVTTLRFGLHGHEQHTLEDIAEIMDLSRERIRQLEASALEKLKNDASYLEEYNNE